MNAQGLIAIALSAALLGLWLYYRRWLAAWKRMRRRIWLHRRPGTIYVVRYGKDASSAVHKVGFTCDWNRRRGELRRKFNGGNKELTVIALFHNVPMAEAVEMEFHKSRFARRYKFKGRRNNEWAQKLGVEDYWLPTRKELDIVVQEIMHRVAYLREDATRAFCGGIWTSDNNNQVVFQRFSDDGRKEEIRPFAKAA